MRNVPLKTCEFSIVQPLKFELDLTCLDLGSVCACVSRVCEFQNRTTQSSGTSFYICGKKQMPHVDAALHASDAAEAVALVRSAARAQTVGAACAHSDDGRHLRLASALEAVQAACSALDDNARPLLPSDPVEGIVHSWQEHGLLPVATVDCTKCRLSLDVDTLQTEAESCMLQWLAERQVFSPALLTVRDGGLRDVTEIDMVVEGAFRSIVAVAAIGSAWVPWRVAVGPSSHPMPAGSLQPPTLLLFHDISVRAATVLAALEELPPGRRLRALLEWLSSLHNLFESRCHGCDAVFAPSVAAAADLLPPTARDSRLLPWHPQCFAAHHGRTAEADYLASLR